MRTEGERAQLRSFGNRTWRARRPPDARSVSVASKSEGVWIEKFAGRVASEGVVGRELAEDGLDGPPVRVEGAMESCGGMEHEGGATSDA
jgi:hypothetical protein